MENAARNSHFPKRFLNSLATCIKRDAAITTLEKQAWKDVKDQGLSLFLPERGASHEVFNARPLRPEILTYCVQDVCFLPLRWISYLGGLAPVWKQRVEEQSSNRVQSSQGSDYQPACRKYSPW